MTAHDPPSQELYDATTAQLHRVAQPYAACVVPIVGRGRRTHYAPKGSGVLFGLDRPHFLLSAAHVLEETRDGGFLRMGFGSRIESIAGRFASTDAAGRGALDVAICVFGEGTNLSTPGVRWVIPGGIQEPPAALTSAPHVVIGFPHAKQAEGPVDDVLDVNAMIHWGAGRDAAEVAKWGHDPGTHLLVDFDKNKVFGPRGATTSVDPYGLSGGAVWSAPDPHDAAKPWMLVGIAIEWRKGRERAILATRVPFALRVLARARSVATAIEPFIAAA